ncbi:MAG: hypothetical protein AAFX78_06480 [Cyanobacteria bacterium J06638_20]
MRKDWICQKQRLEQELGTIFLDTVHGVGRSPRLKNLYVYCSQP